METEAERLFAKYALQFAAHPTEQGRAMLELDRIRLGIASERATELLIGLLASPNQLLRIQDNEHPNF